MLARAVAKLQHAVLQHARVAPIAIEHELLQGSVARFFGSGYLDRNQVTERILSSVKNFEKVDPSKVSSALSWTVTLA
jgi:NADH dehydrogenase (ubiquinone) 1 alpha/beta subcomplex 1, acyl-carrier protein